MWPVWPILQLFPTCELKGARFDLWVRLTAVDPSGNRRSKEISLPVKVDEAPVIDIVALVDGSRQVVDPVCQCMPMMMSA